MDNIRVLEGHKLNQNGYNTTAAMKEATEVKPHENEDIGTRQSQTDYQRPAPEPDSDYSASSSKSKKRSLGKALLHTRPPPTNAPPTPGG